MAKDGAQALREWRGIGSWIDYVEALVVGYGLEEAWEDLGWGERRWKCTVKESVLREEGKRWREEVEKRSNLGEYGNRQAALGRSEYVKGFGREDEIRAEIKRRCEWGIIGLNS